MTTSHSGKPIRIVSVSLHPEPSQGTTVTQLLAQTEPLVREAGEGRPDIISLPELFAHGALPPQEWERAAEDLNGETVTLMARLARELGCIIICPVLERTDGGAIYNSVVFLSAEGKAIGSYHKMMPTAGELDHGIHPGSQTVVVDTPVGRLGALVCFDINFAEVHEALRNARPQIVFFCTMFRGGLRLRYLALECGCYVVSSNSLSNQLINPLGRLLNKAGGRQESFGNLPQYLEETINLNYGVYHLDFNQQLLRSLRNRYAGRVRLEVAQAENVVLLESLDPELPIARIEKEFGLECVLDYFDRLRARIAQQPQLFNIVPP